MFLLPPPLRRPLPFLGGCCPAKWWSVAALPIGPPPRPWLLWYRRLSLAPKPESEGSESLGISEAAAGLLAVASSSWSKWLIFKVPTLRFVAEALCNFPSFCSCSEDGADPNGFRCDFPECSRPFLRHWFRAETGCLGIAGEGDDRLLWTLPLPVLSRRYDLDRESVRFLRTLWWEKTL